MTPYICIHVDDNMIILPIEYEKFLLFFYSLERSKLGLNATNSQHFGTANFPANIAAEKLKTSV